MPLLGGVLAPNLGTFPVTVRYEGQAQARGFAACQIWLCT